jgi:phosphoribosylaminoimidazole (AIR) synthetase
MYATFNMGIGFCAVVAEQDAQPALDALKKTGEDAVRIGHVTATPGKSVSIPAQGLTGTGDTFTQAGTQAG